jgi:hypothetical protein
MVGAPKSPASPPRGPAVDVPPMCCPIDFVLCPSGGAVVNVLQSSGSCSHTSGNASHGVITVHTIAMVCATNMAFFVDFFWVLSFRGIFLGPCAAKDPDGSTATSNINDNKVYLQPTKTLGGYKARAGSPTHLQLDVGTVPPRASRCPECRPGQLPPSPRRAPAPPALGRLGGPGSESMSTHILPPSSLERGPPPPSTRP